MKFGYEKENESWDVYFLNTITLQQLLFINIKKK